MRNSLGQFLKGTHWRPQRPHWDADWLREQYLTRGRSTGDLAVECECTDAALLYWLKKHGIPRRDVSAARALKKWGLVGSTNGMHGRTGATSPTYIDGSSPERQRLYVQGAGRAFLREVLARDGYACRKCRAGKTKPKGLHVHHVKPWAGNEALRLDPVNAVTLCGACHSWVHSRQNIEREFLA